jgi:hypothetical protein
MIHPKALRAGVSYTADFDHLGFPITTPVQIMECHKCRKQMCKRNQSKTLTPMPPIPIPNQFVTTVKTFLFLSTAKAVFETLQ